jgi:hypothetical protein
MNSVTRRSTGKMVPDGCSAFARRVSESGLS